jgi:hypothetical protein
VYARRRESSLPTIALYVVLVNVLFALGQPAFGAAPTAFAFLLKDTLHFDAERVAAANALAALPLYVGSAFGFVRDRWSPFGLGDRGHFIVFGALSAAAYAALAAMPFSYGSLVVGFVAVSSLYQLLVAAQNGVTTWLAQTHRMTGRLSALTQGLQFLFFGLSFAVGGEEQGEGKSRQLFAALGAITLLFVPFGAWKPRAVFGEGAPVPVASTPALGEVVRLLRHRPLWPALAAWLLFQFCPIGTPLVFFMTRDLGGTQAHYGWFMGIGMATAVPACLAYVLVCRRWPLRRTLVWATVLNVPCLVPLLFVHGPSQGIAAAPFYGLVSGFAQCAYYDLYLRSIPKGLEGVGGMLMVSGFFVATRLADLLGAAVYAHGGFTTTVVVTAAATALVLGIIPLVPDAIARDSEARELVPAPRA